jgi:gas vesicle protein
MAQQKAHKGRTKTFAEETYAEQSKSITAEVKHLKDAIKAHIRQAAEEGKPSPKEKRLESLRKLIGELETYEPPKAKPKARA